MARPEKVAEVDAVREGLSGAAATLLTHYRGLSVTEMSELRLSLRAANAQMRIVKNTLARRAADAEGIDGLRELLAGPTGLVFCDEDPVGPAKALKAFQKDHPALIIRGGFLDGEVLDEREALALADLESREELLAKLAGLMDGALANTARLLQAATEKQARLFAALVDAGGPEAKGFTPSAAAEPSDAAPQAEESSSDAADAEAVAEGAPASADAAEPSAADEPSAAEASGEPAADEATDEDVETS